MKKLKDDELREFIHRLYSTTLNAPREQLRGILYQEVVKFCQQNDWFDESSYYFNENSYWHKTIGLIDDYDVSEVEEAQMETSKKYGW